MGCWRDDQRVLSATPTVDGWEIEQDVARVSLAFGVLLPQPRYCCQFKRLKHVSPRVFICSCSPVPHLVGHVDTLHASCADLQFHFLTPTQDFSLRNATTALTLTPMSYTNNTFCIAEQCVQYLLKTSADNQRHTYSSYLPWSTP